MTIIRNFRDEYERKDFQDGLHRIYADVDKEAGLEAWAVKVLLTHRNDPQNAYVAIILTDLNKCISLLCNIVRTWEHALDPNFIEQEIHEIFEPWRLKRLLVVCCAMNQVRLHRNMCVPICCFCNRKSSRTLVPIGREVSQCEEQDPLTATWYNPIETANVQHCLLRLLKTKRFCLLEDKNLARWFPHITERQTQGDLQNAMPLSASVNVGSPRRSQSIQRISSILSVRWSRHFPKVKDNLVFLCHSGANKELVREVNRRLRLNLGVPTFFDEQAVEPGNTISEKVYQGIVNASVVVFFFSHPFFKKKWPPAELQEFLDRRNQGDCISFLPIVIDMTREEFEAKAPRDFSSIFCRHVKGEDVFLVEKVVRWVEQTLKK